MISCPLVVWETVGEIWDMAGVAKTIEGLFRFGTVLDRILAWISAVGTIMSILGITMNWPSGVVLPTFGATALAVILLCCVFIYARAKSWSMRTILFCLLIVVVGLGSYFWITWAIASTGSWSGAKSGSANCSELLPSGYWITEDQSIKFVRCSIERDRIGQIDDWLVRRMIGRALMYNGLNWRYGDSATSSWKDVYTTDIEQTMNHWRYDGSKSFKELSGYDFQFLTAVIIDVDWPKMALEVDKKPPEGRN